MRKTWTATRTLLLIAGGTSAFTIPPPLHFKTRCMSMTTTQSVLASTTAGKFFQLEELEDQDTSTTEIFLNENGVVTVGETNGPPPIETYGTWSESNDGSFRMTLFRTFSTGHDGSDMGEFRYRVERLFMGELTKVGAKVAVAGSMHSIDEVFGDRKVGFFNLIDTTSERLGEEESIFGH